MNFHRLEANMSLIYADEVCEATAKLGLGHWDDRAVTVNATQLFKNK